MLRLPSAASTSFPLRVLAAFLGSRLVVFAGFYFSALLIAIGLPGVDPKPHVRQISERHLWRWLSGNVELSLPAPPAANSDTLVMVGYAIAPDLRLAVSIAGTPVDTLRVGTEPREYHLALPRAIVVAAPSADLRIALSIRSSDFSPRELTRGRASDERRLAFCLQGLRYGVAQALDLSLEDSRLVIRGGYPIEGREKKIDFGHFLVEAAIQWDAGWYYDIAQNGYRFSADDIGKYQPTAFYPLYPLVCRGVSAATGMSLPVVMLVLANLFAALGIVVFAQLLRRMFSIEIAWATILLLSFYPLSVYFSLPYTESLLLLLMASTLALLQHRRIVLAAVLCGISTACRPTAIALVPAILWHHFRPAGRWERPNLRRLVASCGLGVLASSGIIAYAAYLGARFGAPLAFSQAQTGWIHSIAHSPLEMLTFSWVWRQLWWTLVHSPLALLVDPRAWEHWSLLAAFFVLLISARRLPFSWTLVGVIIPLIPYAFFGRTNLGLTSMARYVALDLPVFVGLALYTSRPDRTALLATLIGIFSAMLLVASVLFVSGNYFVG